MLISVAKLFRSTFLAAAMFIVSAHAIAAATDSPPAVYPAIPLVHTSWLIKDGAPPGAVSMAQTPDGWIWISSPVGLFRFDGVSFTRYRPPPGQTMPMSMHRMGVLNDGTLWVTARFGGLYLIKGKEFRYFEANKNKFPGGSMANVLRDADGRIWVASWYGLFSLAPDGSTWRNMNPELGLPDTPINDLMLDKKGTTWVVGPKAIYARRKDQAIFQQVSRKIGWGRLGEAPDGTIWSSDVAGNGVQKLRAERDDRRYDILKRKDFNVFNFLIDRLGNFWLPRKDGIIRVAFDKDAPLIQEYTIRQGLSGATVNTVFEDREGNIWVLTDSGIDQFRASRLRQLSVPSIFAEAPAILAGKDGDFWIDNNYYRNVDSKPEPLAPCPVKPDFITVLYRDPKAGMWCTNLEGLWKLDGVKRVKVRLPRELEQSAGSVINSLLMDSTGSLWMSFANDVWRLKQGVWQKYANRPELKNVLIVTMVSAPDGSIWFGSVRQNILILRDGKVHELGQAQGLDVGAIMQIVPNEKGMYISGENGLAFFNGRRAIRIRGEGDEVFPSITGLVIMPNGDLWANSGVGLISISASEMAKSRSDPNHLVKFHRFDQNDGLIGTAPPLFPLPSLVRTTSNELIISTTGGTFRFEPVPSQTAKLALPIDITGIIAAGRTYAPSLEPTLAPAPDTVRIDYTALRFTLPNRVRFRYMLDGIDQQWQDAGTRRSAFYTKLPPGAYTFKVMAASDDGVWNEKFAKVSFEIAPTLVQTGWFKLVCLAGLLFLGWLLHRLRLHVALRLLAATFEARAAERERIARDLHDTLLQSVQGLILTFGGIVKRMPDAEPLKNSMNNALDLATDVMVEGRNKVNVLRTVVDQCDELALSLEDFGRRLADQHMVSFTILLHGDTRPLRNFIRDEIFMIGREAIQNAFAHANASEVKVELAYSDSVIKLSVKDNGCGIDSDARMGRPGHWGMQGMRERAVQLGASLELSSVKDGGTLWQLRVPT